MRLFITGTDTDVGKSFATASLLRAFLECGAKAVALKPVQTGFVSEQKSQKNIQNSLELDISSLDFSQIEPDFKEYIKAGQSSDFNATCYSFAYPASPHFSAGLEGREINAKGILDFIEANSHTNSAQITLIEGAGGILVPLNENESFLDIAKALNAPVILVCKNVLGAINHALLNLEILRQNNLKIAALVLNFHNENDAICISNQQFLAKKFPCPIISLKNYADNENYKNSAKEFSGFVREFLNKK